MKHVAIFALLVAGCAGNNGVRLIDASPEQAEEMRVALDELRVESGGKVDYYLSGSGSVTVAVIPFAYPGLAPEQAAMVRGNHEGDRIYVYPDGQGPLFANTAVHELLHVEGLGHVSERGPELMSARSPKWTETYAAPTCLHAADVAELCALEGCKPSALPAPCD